VVPPAPCEGSGGTGDRNYLLQLQQVAWAVRLLHSLKGSSRSPGPPPGGRRRKVVGGTAAGHQAPAAGGARARDDQWWPCLGRLAEPDIWATILWAEDAVAAAARRLRS